MIYEEYESIWNTIRKKEKELFEYRAKNIPLETCAEIMNVSISTAKRISKRVNNKITRVC